jgi:hypothetical protein
MSSPLFTRFSSADAKRLRAEFDVPSAKGAQFVRDTQGLVFVFARLNLKYDKTKVKDYLISARQSSESLLKICDAVLWPNVSSWSDSSARAAHRIYQAASFQKILAVGGIQATQLRRQFLSKIPVPDEDDGTKIGPGELSKARVLLARSQDPRDVEGAQVRVIFRGLVVAIHKATRLALSLETGQRGRPTADQLSWLAAELRNVYDEYALKPATKGRRGPFAKYLRLCLEAAGKHHRDIMPVLKRAMPPKPTLHKQRLAREAEHSQSSPIANLIASRIKK